MNPGKKVYMILVTYEINPNISFEQGQALLTNAHGVMLFPTMEDAAKHMLRHEYKPHEKLLSITWMEIFT